MPITSVTKDPSKLTITVVADFPVSQQRLWDAFADARQLERFWGPPFAPSTFTRHEFRVGGRSEYFITMPDGKKWPGAWKFTAVNPISSFEAFDGDDNAFDPNGPAAMNFTFETTPTGSRMTNVTRFDSLKALEETSPGMEEGFRAAMPQLDALLLETATTNH